MPDEKTRKIPHRGVVATSLFSVSVLGVVALFQTGFLKHLPNLKLPHFDAEKVHGSAKAYSIFGIPDSLLGMVSYSVTGSLAGLEERSPSVLTKVALAGKTGFDLANAVRLNLYAWRKLHACSLPSLLISAATAVSFSLALQNAWRARGTR